MAKTNRVKLSRKKKWIIGGVAAGLVIVASLFWWQQQKPSESAVTTPYTSVNVVEGTISSSTLLTGSVKAFQEEYVYFDSSKGTDATVTVSVGDQITAGQQLVQYDTTTLQASYDAAVRNLNKADRQLAYFKKYGSTPTTTVMDEEPSTSTVVTEKQTAQEKASYDQQLQDLNDALADAQAEVDKAQLALNETVIVSDVSGTVVEVNKDIDPSAKDSQTLVHVATEGQLQIQGTLTEYDLANIKKGQAVKIKSKVYPDQEWTGNISYISNYPNRASSDTTTASGTGNSASYDYKVDLTGQLGNLKQGFTVSVEVVNDQTYKLIPLTSILTEKTKNYVWVYDDATGKVSKIEVTLGQADATRQEVLTGLEVGQIVISNPDKRLKNGDKLDDVISEDTSASGETEVSKE